MALIHLRTETFRNPLAPFDFGAGLSLEVLPCDLDLERLAGLDRLDLPLRREVVAWEPSNQAGAAPDVAGGRQDVHKFLRNLCMS
ncbi:hypothetical protein PEC18_05590 [Paucibacter sp. O1-1]|nr:hypothetical protein [Paucibacter sp. O1-1]MCU7370357.1 hypothetical protein [Paucibacter sp. O1-1]MDA3825336.1 hypothetical protein [Paucibacter sp. O1-1]MDA3825342.1 hypothetical protein [Paucibacter sp. O1-1]